MNVGNMEKEEELLEKIKKNHKYELTSLDVLIPEPIDLGDYLVLSLLLKPKSVVATDLGIWLRFDWERVVENTYWYQSYKKLLMNFRYEVNSFNDSMGFEEMWFFNFLLFKEGMTRSNKIIPAGFCGIRKNEGVKQKFISCLWIHPYIRRQGVTHTLLSHIIENELIAVEPPVTYEMECAINKASESVSDAAKERNLKETAKLYEHTYGINILYENTEEISYLRYFFDLQKDKINQENLDRFLSLIRVRKPETFDEILDILGEEKQQVPCDLKHCNYLSNKRRLLSAKE